MRPGTIRCASGGGDEGVPHAARTPGFVVVMAPPRKRRKYDANPSSDETFAPAKINQDAYPFEQEEETSIRQIIISVGMGAFFALSVPIAQVIDSTTRLTSPTEGLAEGVRRITQGKGDDIVIESICGTVTSEALKRLGLGGVPITLGYSAGRKTTIDVTDLIWKARGWPASLCSLNQRPRSLLRRAFGMLVGHLPISMSIRPSAVTIRQPRISLAYPIDIRRS
jgi:hypothetical protein